MYSLSRLLFMSIVLLCFIIATVWYLIPSPIVPIMVSLIPLGILITLNQPFWLVTLFVLFSFFRIHEAIPTLYHLKIPLVLSLGALFALIWHTLLSQKIKIYGHPSLTWLGIFWGLTTMGMFTASNVELALTAFTNVYWKIIVMTLAIIWVVNNDKHIGQISFSIVLSGTLIASITLYNLVNEIGLVEGTRVTIGRDIGSMLGDPNDLSLVLMFPLAFSINLGTTKGISFLKQVIAIITTGLFIGAIMATQSRGGLLGSLAVISICALKLIYSKNFFILLGVIGLLYLYLLSGILSKISGRFFGEIMMDESSIGRIFAWKAAYRMAMDNPLTGVGLNNFFPNYFFYSSYWDGSNHAVHSTWFGVLAEIGIPGFIVFIIFIFSVIHTARDTLRRISKSPELFSPHLTVVANSVYAGFIGSIVSSTFLTQAFNWPIYILAALTIAVSNLTQNNSQNKNNNFVD
ncbi:exopolysaccharide production protein [Candidatus Photodesmus blepharus]|uniref:Exopolysaccharide production protein n=2 Tax=Candidatus Photodesmus blepharonis TaxID=1179155 RepID=A0A084CPL6_9GAMM|nr:O-antigen ligase family protein [Candidatus Photodesmus blepharus]KEY91745.1 exopolysaccharide production protein [Candidatus Photodesmus blepharus]